MTRIHPGFLSRKAVAAILAGTLALTTATVAPARADNKDAIAAAAFFGLVAVGIIAATRNAKARAPQPPIIAPRHDLPAECRFQIRHGPDRGTWFARRCLVANDAHWRLLPERCKRRVELPRAHFSLVAYRARCLARAGYRPDHMVLR